MTTVYRDQALTAMLQWGLIEHQVNAGRLNIEDRLKELGGLAQYRDFILDYQSDKVGGEETVPREQALTAMIAYGELSKVYLDATCHNIYTVLDQGLRTEISLDEHVLFELAPAIEQGYRAVKDQMSEPFDLDFVPRFVILAQGSFDPAWENLALTEAQAVDVARRLTFVSNLPDGTIA